MKKDNIIMKKWYEYRTPKGYWSTVKNEFEQKAITDDEYFKFIDNLWRNDRKTRSYTRLGYLPTRITNVAPCNSQRVVYEFLV